MTRSYECVFLLLSLAPLIAPATAHAAEGYGNCTNFITSLPAVISTSGTYCFNQNLSTPITSGDAIEIFGNNITIDCNDFKLDGLAAGLSTQAYGIAATDFSNVTVRHCSVRGFFAGLRLVGGNSRGHVVEDNRFDGNTFYALLVEGDGSVVRRNRVFNTGGTTAIAGLPATGISTTYAVDVLDNTVSGVAATSGGGASAFGIFTGSNTGSNISGNRIRAMHKDGLGTAYGISSESSDRIVIRNNDLVGDASGGSQGLSCDSGQIRAKDNVINGFATGISGCSNNGGNVIKP